MTQIQEAIFDKIGILPIIEQKKVLEFIESRIKHSTQSTPRQSLGAMLRNCLADVPDEVLERMPIDLSENFDQYMFGEKAK